MWRNYLIVGIRALTKNKTYAFINIFGLAIGLAACLMLLIYVRYETSYDNALPNAENTYQFQTYYTEKATGETTNGRRMPIRHQVRPRSWLSSNAASTTAMTICGPEERTKMLRVLTVCLRK